MSVNHAPAPPPRRYVTNNHGDFARQAAEALTLGGWLCIFLLLFVGAGLFSYLPCASFAELGLLVFFILSLAGNRWRWRRTSLDPLIGAWLAVQVFATGWAYAMGYGARSPYAPGADAGGVFGPIQILFDQFAAFAAYYVAAWKATEFKAPKALSSAQDWREARASAQESPKCEPLFAAFALSAGVVLLLCLIEWAASFAHPTDDPRIQATFTNPNLLASYLLLAVSVAAGWALESTARKAARIGFGLLASGLLFALWLSQSRGAWIGIALGAGFTAAVLWTHRRAAGDTERSVRGAKALRLLACGCLLALLFGAFVAPKIEAHWHGHSEEERAIIWKAAVSIIRAHPWLGIGANGFAAAMADLHMKQKNDFNPSGYPLVPSVHLHAHNLILQAWVEKGIAGIVVCLWLIAAILARSLRLLTKDYRARPLLPVATAVGGGLIALLTQCVADYTLWYAPILILAWAALGVFACLSQLTGNPTGESPP